MKYEMKYLNEKSYKMLGRAFCSKLTLSLLPKLPEPPETPCY